MSTTERSTGQLARAGWLDRLILLRGRELQLALAALSLGAGAIHFAVAPEHFAEYWVFGMFFVGLGWFQSFWAVLYTIRPLRLLGVAAAVVNAATVGLWLWTRAVGVPIGPETGRLEPVGAPDLVATAFELAIVLGLVWRIAGHHGDLRDTSKRFPQRVVLLAGFVVVITTVTALALLLPPPTR